MLRVTLYNLLGLCAVVVALELIFGTWFSQTHALYQFTKPRDLQVVQANPLDNGQAKITYTRDENGFRGLNGDVTQIDLITVGGSTTDQRLLDDSATFQSVLKTQFKTHGRDVMIANAGVDGQSSFGHIANFGSWFNQIDGLQARYVLFYVGINDLLILEEDEAYDNTDASSIRLRVQLFIREKSIFYQSYRVLKGILKTPERSHSLNQMNLAVSEPFATKPLLTESELSSGDKQANLRALSDRIATLADLTRKMGAEPIFVTQRSAAWTRRDGAIMGLSEVGPGFFNQLIRRVGPINGIDIYNIERAVAQTVLSRCQEERAICLDLAAEIDFDVAQDFYDEFHTTASGSAAIGQYLYQKLVDQGV